MRIFDRKFGKTFLDGVDASPGIYWFSDEDGRILYVGKAKNLRARLSQYRNAGRTKKDRKKRAIIRGAARLETRICLSENDALLIENEWILAHRPPLNVVGAYEFLYPAIGIRREQRITYLVCTTHPERWRELGFRMHGCFGSRLETRESFGVLIELLAHIGHSEAVASSRWKEIPHSSVKGFRQLEEDLIASLHGFLSGESPDFLGLLVLQLVEKPRARNAPREIRKLLLRLKRFFRNEPLRLRTARVRSGYEPTFVPQIDRDRILIKGDGA